MLRTSVFAATIAGTLSAVAAGGGFTIVPLVVEGDAVEGVGLVTSINNIAVNDAGLWLVEADTDHANTDADSVLLRGGIPQLREGDPLPLPAGATLDSFDSIVINNDGQSAWNFFLDGTQDIFDDSGLYFGTELVVQEGMAAIVDGFSEGTTYIGFFDVKINGGGDFMSVLSIDDPLIDSSVDRAIIHFGNPGMGFIRTLVAKEGDVLPGQTEAVADFGTGPHQSAFNDLGNILFFVDLTGPSATDGAYYIYVFGFGAGSDLTLLAQEGSASPVKGRLWQTLSSPELDLNDADSYVYSGSLDGDTATNLVIVRDGTVFRQEGDAPPDPGLGDFSLTSFGSGPLEIDNRGLVLWYGDWSDPDTDIDTGLFLEDTLLVQEGVTTIDGVAVDTIRGVEDGYHMSDTGRFVIFEAVLADGREGAFLIDTAEGCPGDLDGSGAVDVVDLVALILAWGECPAPPDGCPADVDGDGAVTVTDLVALILGWGACS